MDNAIAHYSLGVKHITLLRGCHSHELKEDTSVAFLSGKVSAGNLYFAIKLLQLKQTSKERVKKQKISINRKRANKRKYSA